MKSLEIKNAVFSQNEMTITQFGKKITIKLDDVESMSYAKPSLLNYILSAHGRRFPGRLMIYVKRKNEGRKMRYVKIKYEDFKKLPEEYNRFF